MDYIKPLQIKAYDTLKAMILEGHFKKGEFILRLKLQKSLEFRGHQFETLFKD